MEGAIVVISGERSDIGTILNVNNQVCSMFGYDSDQLIG